MKINIPKEEIVKLFNDMDINNDGTIEYNELLNYIRKARKEKEKIDRMQKIDMTVQRIREKSGVQEHEVVTAQTRGLPPPFRPPAAARAPSPPQNAFAFFSLTPPSKQFLPGKVSGHS